MQGVGVAVFVWLCLVVLERPLAWLMCDWFSQHAHRFDDSDFMDLAPKVNHFMTLYEHLPWWASLVGGVIVTPVVLLVIFAQLMLSWLWTLEGKKSDGVGGDN